MLLAEPRISLPLAGKAGERVQGERPGVNEAFLVFTIVATLYLAAAGIMAFWFHVATAQALGLVANAAYVLLSRDPHLAAIGFVGSPLPSVLLLPLLPFRVFWPALTEAGFAACIASALFMAGAAYQLRHVLGEAGVRRTPRLVVTLLFAVHPLILYTAASGAGEAAFLFFLLVSVRHLARWLRAGDTMGELVAGFALAGAYLARYDAALAGAAAIVVVAVLSATRSPRARFWTVACDALIVGGPLAATVALWAGAAWLVTGSPLPQVFAPYGYLTQLDALRSQGAQLVAGAAGSPVRILAQVLSLEPGLPAAALLMIGLFGRRGWSWLSGPVVLGPLAAAIAVASLLGWAFPWLRLLIVVVPLVTVLLALGLAAPARGTSPRRWAGPLAATLMLAAALPTTAVAMLNPRTGQEEQPALTAIFDGGAGVAVASGAFASARTAAGYLDGQQLGDGVILLDSFTGFPVILASSTPRQFLITSDREFALALARPAAFGVRYVLVPAPSYMNSLGSLDAVNRAYPELYPSAAASGARVREFSGPGNRVEWRLYRVSAIAPSSPAPPS